MAAIKLKQLCKVRPPPARTGSVAKPRVEQVNGIRLDVVQHRAPGGLSECAILMHLDVLHVETGVEVQQNDGRFGPSREGFGQKLGCSRYMRPGHRREIAGHPESRTQADRKSVVE